MRHEDQLIGSVLDHSAYYVVGIWRPWAWKPYVGFDRLHLDDRDVFFTNAHTDLKRYLVGVRWDFHPFNALKIEYRHDDRGDSEANVVRVQTAFTF